MLTVFRLSAVTVLACVIAVGLGNPTDVRAIGLAAIDGHLGYMNGEEEIGGSFLLGVFADLGEVVPDLALEGGIDFWTKSYDFGGFYSDAELRFTNIGILGGVRYDIPTTSTITPFVFGALGLNVARMSGEFSYDDPWSGETVTDDYSDTSLEVGIRGGGGLTVDVSPGMDFVARLGYDINGGADYFFVTGGVVIPIGR